MAGNKYFKHKDEMKELFLNFIDEPAKSPRRRDGDGIYISYYIGNTTNQLRYSKYNSIRRKEASEADFTGSPL